MWAVIIASVWKSYPPFPHHHACRPACRAIPNQYYEAARIDGCARGWRRLFRHHPTRRCATFIAIAVFSCRCWLHSGRSKRFLVMTGGGPARATETAVADRIYNETFQAYRGRAAAPRSA